MSAENELQHGSDVQIGTAEWCESHIMTNKDMAKFADQINSLCDKWEI